MDSTEANLLFALIGGVIFISAVAIVGGFLHYRRERLLTHAERMKALELGREMPEDAATARIKAAFGVQSSEEKQEDQGSLARKCFSTALWVAFWGFLAASQGAWVNHSLGIAIGASVAAVGVTACICGTILALRGPAGQTTAPLAKESTDADVFDVVSRRG
jgi:hypothetical protein